MRVLTFPTAVRHYAEPCSSCLCQQPARFFGKIYELFNWKLEGFSIGGVMWSTMPRQIPQLIGLFAVVAFGSSLDVAAIQQDSPTQLDFNAELMTVGEFLIQAVVHADEARCSELI